jgi:hypothetical protein
MTGESARVDRAKLNAAKPIEAASTDFPQKQESVFIGVTRS